MKQNEYKVAHIYGAIPSREYLIESLESILDDYGCPVGGDGPGIVVFVDQPTFDYPNGSLIVLPSGRAVRIVTIEDWPEEPLARPFAHLASALSAGRDALLGGSDPMEAAKDALHRLECFIGSKLTKRDLPLVENITHDMIGWAPVLLGTTA